MMWFPCRRAWNNLMAKVDAIKEVVDRIDQRTITMVKSLDDVLDDIATLKTEEEGLAALTANLKAQVDAITAGSLTAAQQAKVDAIFQAVEDRKAEVQAAIVANTPAA